MSGHAWRPDVWADDFAYYLKCPECGKTEDEHDD